MGRNTGQGPRRVDRLADGIEDRALDRADGGALRIGVVAFVKAIVGETEPIERQFLLAEIAAELMRMRVEDRRGCLRADVIREEIQAIVRDIRSQIEREREGLPKSARRYLEAMLDATESAS